VREIELLLHVVIADVNDDRPEFLASLTAHVGEEILPPAARHSARRINAATVVS
jgi:hypothetical protein